MHLKQLFFGVLLCSTALLGGCNESAPAPDSKTVAPEKTYQWKMVSTWPPNFPVFQEGVDRFAKSVETMSNGRIKIQVYAGGELVPALQTFDAVSQGSVQLGHGAAYYWAGKVPAAQFMSSVPFGMNASGMNAWLYGGDGLKLWRELYKPFNVVPFPVGNTGVQMGGWFKKEINSIEDLKGLKMRMPGLGGKVLSKAGGVPVLLAGSELYTALERGNIDAAEWVGPYHDKRLGLDRAARYYYTPGWHEPGTTLELIVNQAAWDSLTPDLQKMIEEAAMATNQWMHIQFEILNLNALRELLADKNVKVLAFPPAVLAQLKQITSEVLAEEAAKDADFRRVYDNYKAFAADNDIWHTLSEISYYSATHPDFPLDVQKVLQNITH